MITPQFELEQFENYLLITITAKYIKSNDVEIYIEENEFKFYVKPYFLRLYFPCHIVEDGNERAEYDINTGIFKVHVPKKNPGEHFPDLDMLTTLLAKKKKKMLSNGIEVVENTNEDKSNAGDEGKEKDDQGDAWNSDEDEEGDDELDWEVDQELYKPPDILQGYKYGFANKLNGVFTRFQGEMFDVVDVLDPDNTPPLQRREMRTIEENAKFDSQHYVADLMDDAVIQGLIKYRAPWDVEYDRILTAYKSSYPETSNLITPKGNHSVFTEEENLTFNEEEKKVLIQLPNKDYILDKEEEQIVFLSLVDVIFSYAYNNRTTEGENTSESPWTICKISSTLSWLDSFKNPQDVLRSCARRCLCYPLYRHWYLVQRVVDDVRRIFLLGRRWILRCLLEIRSILQQDENRYIFNDLYITDLCIWMQKTKKKKILSICNKLQCIKVSKEDIDLDLINLEKSVNEWMDKSSGDEADSSDSSDEEIISSDDDTDSSEEEDSSSSTEIVSSLDSDDFEEEDLQNMNKNTTRACVNSEPTPEAVPSSGATGGIEVIKTGLEELLHAQKLVDGDLQENEGGL